MEKITAITVCVNYSDFLIHCVEANKKVFDKWIIVTDTKDIKTKELCDKYSLTCIQTDIFYEGGTFRKYAGINEALKLVDKNSWVIFIDGDIILSPLSKRVLEHTPLDKTKLYGIDRLNCNGFEKFIQYKKGMGVLRENWLLHDAKMLEFGARIVHIHGEQGDNGRFTGWKPLGFFQLCHRSAFTDYPEGSIDASHGDLAFAKLWSRENRVLIPEMLGVHIETGEYKSMNWQGRRSSKFTYSKKISCIKRLYDRFVIWINSLCTPNYYKKTCILCKLLKF